MRAPGVTLLAALLLAPPAGAQEGANERTPAAGASAEEARATARITYVSGSTAYLDAGSQQGLREKLRLELMRDGAVVAVLEVSYVSPSRAVCSILQGAEAVRAGDSVSYVPAAPAAAVTAAAAPAEPAEGKAPPAPPRRASDAGIHGRVGVRYLAVRDHSATSAEYSQPALDLRLDGPSLGGSPVGLKIDARTRRTYQTFADGTEDNEGRTRVYAASVSWDDALTPVRFTLGRQSSPELAVISIFDGVMAEYAASSWSLGAFGGTQPDPLDFGYSSDIREYGVYHQVHGEPAASRRWALTTGLIGSYQESEINREFLYVQGRYTGPEFLAFFTEELDYNRGWKKDEAGESTFSSTGTFLSLQWRPVRVVTLRGGYDNRRNVRLYRDRITPVTEFDDAYRTGFWAGVMFRAGDRIKIGVDGRRRSGGDAGDADAYTVTFGMERIAKVIGLHARSTRYQNDYEEGSLHSLDLDFAIGPRVNLGVTGGRRDATRLSGSDAADNLTWLSLDMNVVLGRGWFGLLSLERSDGDLEAADQAYLFVTYRF
jgi:hypothetical protein